MIPSFPSATIEVYGASVPEDLKAFFDEATLFFPLKKTIILFVCHYKAMLIIVMNCIFN